MKTVVIIQARMGSHRLPGKVLMPLAGRPAIQHVLERAKLIQGVDEVVLATSTASSDDLLVSFCSSLGVRVIRGSELDVLDRYYQAAKSSLADTIVRITGDCPLLDPLESSKVINFYFNTKYDYVSNNNPPTLPDGLDTEVFSFEALEAAWNNAKKKSEREHVTLYIYSHLELFKVENIENKRNLNTYRWTLDEKADYQLLSLIYAELISRGVFGHLNEVLDIFDSRPDLFSINNLIQRNEGLILSQKMDFE